MISYQESIAAGDVFFVAYGIDPLNRLKASSWDEAMEAAADYMSEIDHGADEYGTQHVRYRVYRLPAVVADPHLADYYVSASVMELYEERVAIHTQEPRASDCPHGAHVEEGEACSLLAQQPRPLLVAI